MTPTEFAGGVATESEVDYDKSEVLSSPFYFYRDTKSLERVFELITELANSATEFISAYRWFASTKGEEEGMNWQEKYIDKLDRDMNEIKLSLRATEEHISQMINQTLGEMRDRDNQRHKEFLEISRKMDSLENKLTSRMDSIEAKTERQLNWVFTMALSVIIGVAAMVITVLLGK